MIVITGAAGFIGSNLISMLNMLGMRELVLVDSFYNSPKNKNLLEKGFILQVQRDHFFEWLDKNHDGVEFIFHLGARTNTAEFNEEIFNRLNLGYSKKIWSACAAYSIPLIYASSAATYGMGELGYSDDHEIVHLLKPLNPYGNSKNDFDKWVLEQKNAPPFWTGLKFFNVYGPNEYHKSRMASVVFHTYNQINKTGKMKLFRSHKPGIPDGGQKRDFVYVKDVVKVILFLFTNRPSSGIYNLGTGKASTFMDLAAFTFKAMNLKPVIEFIDTPEDIRDKYQYFTEARIEKLRNAGYSDDFYSLSAGIDDYVKNYLMKGKYI
jgi:ADP-L-glycero-D-manno-heptose 6-epimerase